MNRSNKFIKKLLLWRCDVGFYFIFLINKFNQKTLFSVDDLRKDTKCRFTHTVD